jgi:hypothetical protein
MLSKREEIEGRINAFVGSWLDSAPESWGDDFDINTFALIFEVTFPPEDEDGKPASNIGWTCSDDRNWVQSALFRRALVESEAHIYVREADED